MKNQSACLKVMKGKLFSFPTVILTQSLIFHFHKYILQLNTIPNTRFRLKTSDSLKSLYSQPLNTLYYSLKNSLFN